jgi:hypothetical protein
MHAWDMGIGERNRFAVALATTQGELGVIYIPPHTNLLIVGWSTSTHAPLSLLIPSSQTRGVVTRPSSRDHRCRPGRHPPPPCRLAPSPSRHRLPPSPSSSAPPPWRWPNRHLPPPGLAAPFPPPSPGQPAAGDAVVFSNAGEFPRPTLAPIVGLHHLAGSDLAAQPHRHLRRVDLPPRRPSLHVRW